MTFRTSPLAYVGPLNTVSSGSFTTNFSDAPENPISEGGVWFHTSNAWANIATTTSPNRAVGTQTGTSGNDNDSYAYLSGFGSNVSVQATIYKDPTLVDSNGSQEVELLLRMSDSSTQAKAYECNWSSGGFYSQIVRWNGNLNNFTLLADTGSITAPVTGDIVKATIVGGVITTFINRGSGFVQLQQFTDNTFATGQPGMGMWFLLGGGNSTADRPKFGFSSFSVSSI